MIILQTDILIIVDVQNDFCPGGALAIRGGDQVVPIINDLSRKFSPIILTQDWHPADHSSFASSHGDAKPFSSMDMTYGVQTLWPDHCIAGTKGAAFHDDLHVDKAELIIRKGFRRAIDSYSAFYENDQTTPTGLAGYLRERGFKRLFFSGLAMDYCVGFSALDAVQSGFEAIVIEDACRAIDLAGSLADMRSKLKDAGVLTVTSPHIQAGVSH